MTWVLKEFIAVREEMPDQVDLTSVFKEIGKVREQMAKIKIPEAIDLKPLEEALAELSKQVAIVSKENELQDILIEEIKAQSKNPLSK